MRGHRRARSWRKLRFFWVMTRCGGKYYRRQRDNVYTDFLCICFSAQLPRGMNPDRQVCMPGCVPHPPPLPVHLSYLPRLGQNNGTNFEFLLHLILLLLPLFLLLLLPLLSLLLLLLFLLQPLFLFLFQLLLIRPFGCCFLVAPAEGERMGKVPFFFVLACKRESSQRI